MSRPPPARSEPIRSGMTPGRGPAMAAPSPAPAAWRPASVQPGLDQGHWALAFVVYLVFVIYGSLVPLDWRPMPLADALTRFANIGFLELGAVSRADWVANIVLYVPLGFLACVALLGPKPPRWRAYLGATLIFVACVALAVAVEFTQVYFAPRTVSLNDLLAEVIGSAGGVLLWLLARGPIVRLGDAFAAGGRASVVAAATLFMIGYVLLSLFPYDFVVSTAELTQRLQAGAGGWLLGDCSDWLRCVAVAAAEVLVIAPLGVLLVLLFPRLGLGALFLLGLALGVTLELLQLLLFSGSSRLLSVPLRGVGLAAGGVLARLLLRGPGIDAAADLLYRALPVLTPLYLVALAALSGWLRGPWLAPAQGLARLGELGWVPFYYHYWTSEPVAMASLLAQLGLYAPVGVAFAARALSWRGRSVSGLAPAATALVLALIIETGKLFAADARPDPTNLIIAPAGALLAWWAILWFARALQQVTQPPARRRPVAATASAREPPAASARTAPTPPAHPEPEGADAGGTGVLGFLLRRPALPAMRPAGLVPAVLAGAVVAAGLWLYPLAAPALAVALLAYAVALWRWPWLWLLVVPIALPVLDLSPSTGLLPLDEFDLVLLVSLGVAGLRLSGVRPARWPHVSVAAAVLLLWLTWLVATARGLWPLWLGLPAPGSHTPLATWLVGKGLLWALLCVQPLRRLRRAYGSAAMSWLLLGGLAAGAVVTGLVVAWERQVFVGLWDLTSDFRTTGPFASMRTGGAHIDAYLALVFPMLLVWTLRRTTAWGRIGGGLAVALTGYAMLVTFSRAGLLGLTAGSAVAILGVLMGRRRGALVAWGVPAAAVLAVVLLAVPMLSGGFGQARLATVQRDLDARLEHWRNALSLTAGRPATLLLGDGFGQYPLQYLEALGGRTPPGSYAVLKDDTGQPHLRLGSGEASYLDQPVAARAGQTYRLSVSLRPVGSGGRLAVALCRKALLYSFGCVWQPVDLEDTGSAAVDADATGGWQAFEAAIETGSVAPAGVGAPLKLSLHNAGAGGAVDIRRIALVGADGRDLVANGDFRAGDTRWLFTTDQRLGWHVDQQWIETYLAQGLLGVAAAIMLLLAVIKVLWPALRAGRLEAAAFAGGLAGFVAVGLLGSTLDAGRTLMLFYFTALAAALLVRGSSEPHVRRAGWRGRAPTGVPDAADLG